MISTKKFKTLFLMASILALLSCKSNADLPTANKLDVNKYAGLWYEIARLPNTFEKGLDCTTANYTILENGKIEVKNKGRKVSKNNEISDITGTAWVPNPEFPAQLKVRFFWPFAGDYWVIALGDNYEYALVGAPNRKYLWILGREKTMDEATYSKLVTLAKEKGFDTSLLERINQDCK